MGNCHLPDNLDDAGNNPDIRPQPCFVFLGSFVQRSRSDQFGYQVDRREPAEEEEQTNGG